MANLPAGWNFLGIGTMNLRSSYVQSEKCLNTYDMKKLSTNLCRVYF